jgi:hypothetical protein
MSEIWDRLGEKAVEEKKIDRDGDKNHDDHTYACPGCAHARGVPFFKQVGQFIQPRFHSSQRFIVAGIHFWLVICHSFRSPPVSKKLDCLYVDA